MNDVVELSPFSKSVLAAVTLKSGRLAVDRAVAHALTVDAAAVAPSRRRAIAVELVALIARFDRVGKRAADDASRFVAGLVVVLLGNREAALTLAPALSTARAASLVSLHEACLPPVDAPHDLYARLLAD